MSMNTFNRQTISHRRLLLTRRYRYVLCSPLCPRSNGRPRRPHLMVMRSMAVAGPSNQQYAQPTYALDGFNQDSAFLTGYKFNPIPITTPLDPNDSLEETTISVRRRLFQPEIEWGINFDETMCSSHPCVMRTGSFSIFLFSSFSLSHLSLHLLTIHPHHMSYFPCHFAAT
ncbi:hypothetical protein CPB85DRAFT_844945 [Mucidula mucida]|nr:hypothetical protein CPB85DRAFT_844945 [Mucidula mucida]